jgi:hypothetical protein
VTLSPDLAVIDEQRANKPLLMIQTYAQDVDLDATLQQDGWWPTRRSHGFFVSVSGLSTRFGDQR